MSDTPTAMAWPFASRPVCIGMVHLLPLPGSPRAKASMDDIRSRAVEEAKAFADAGCDGVLVENYGDAPFWPDRVEPHTLTCMATIVTDVVAAIAIPVGVNVLRNDAKGAIAVAAASGARFVRVNVHTGVCVADQGLLEGRAADTLRYRASLRAEVSVFADVHVKHAAPLGESDVRRLAADAAYRGLADALIVSGAATGAATSMEEVATVRQAVPDRPVLVGSGVTVADAAALWSVADGLIVGTSVKVDGRTTNPIDPDRLARLMQAIGR